MTTENTPNKSAQTPKKKSIIRFEAVVPLLVIIVLTGIYFKFFFDLNLKYLIEWGGYKALGAEVNVKNVETSFLNASLKIEKIEFTDSEKPEFNLFEIGEIRFSCLWDALLRAKIVINEASIENIAIKTKRDHVGQVMPPEPPPPPGDSALVKEGKVIADKALDNIQEEYSDNVFGDIAAVSQGVDAKEQLKKLEDTLESKKLAAKVEANVNEKQKYWNEKFKTLPQPKELEALGERLKKVKTSNFKDVKELQTSVEEIQKILKEADEKKKVIESASSELQTDVANLEKDVKSLEGLIKSDIKNIQARMKLPDFQGDKLVKALAYPYIKPYLLKFQKYEGLAKKYLPPNLVNKSEKKSDDVPIQPHPRAKGVVYEFGRPNSYPLFWLKRAGISSKANAALNMGDMSGELLNVSTNQALTGKPITLDLKGDFPSLDMSGMSLNLTIDHRRPQFLIDFAFQIQKYLIENKNLLSNKDLSIGFAKTNGFLNLTSQFKQGEGVVVDIKNEFTQMDYTIESKSKELKQFMDSVFASIQKLFIGTHAEGQFPKLAISFDSNIGPELEKAFRTQINAKIEEAKKMIEAHVNEQVEAQKKNIQAQVDKLKNQVQAEVQKINAQVDAQKKEANAQVDKAKADANKQTDQAKKKAEEELKKKLGKDGQKKLDELKKKFKF